MRKPTLVAYGAIGFVIGLAAGLLVMILRWTVLLARRIVQGREETRPQ